jgi:PAS domain-containing protein
MNDFEGVLSLQVEALVAALHAHREQRCRELLHEAERRAQTLVSESRHELRVRVSQAIEEERRRRALALRQAENRVRAALGSATQAFYESLLNEAWPRLTAELEARWADRDSRRAWCRMLVVDAASRLGRSNWTVEHATGLSGDDAAWLGDLLAEHENSEAALVADATLRAGLRIREQSACLDGSIDGLLRNRSAIESRLLAAWERLRRRDSGGPG